MRRVVGERTQRERRDSDEVGGAGATDPRPRPTVRACEAADEPERGARSTV